MTEVYNIAVKIAMQNGVSSVLKVIQTDLFGLNKAVDLTSGKFKTLALVAGGAMSAIAGVAALKGMTKIIEAGDKIIQQQQKLRQLGLGSGDVNSLTSQAISTATSTPGFSASQVLGIQNDLVRSLGTPADANSVLKSVTQDAFVIQQATGDTSDQGILAAIKAVDVQGGAQKNGKIDPKEFAKNLQAMTSAIIVSNGLLSPEQILKITQMAGPTAQGADFASWIFSNLSAFMNMGRISGRGINMAGRDLLAGYSSKVSAAEGVKLGLYGDDAVSKDFNRYYVDPSKMVGGDVLTDPTQGIPAWVQQVLIPKLIAKGFTTPQKMAMEIDKLIPDVTAQRYISQEAVAYVQQQRDASLALGADGSNLYGLSQQTLDAQMQDFTASWQSLIEALGMPAVQSAINVMQNITASLNGWAAWAFANQSKVKIADSLIIGVAAALTILGSVALISGLVILVGSAGTGGLIGAFVAGVIGLVAAFEAFKASFPELFPAGTAADHPGRHWVVAGRGGAWVPNQGGNSGGTTAVHVTNPGDLAQAIKTGLSSALASHQGSTSGFNPRVSPHGTPALASP